MNILYNENLVTDFSYFITIGFLKYMRSEKKTLFLVITLCTNFQEKFQCHILQKSFVYCCSWWSCQWIAQTCKFVFVLKMDLLSTFVNFFLTIYLFINYLLVGKWLNVFCESRLFVFLVAAGAHSTILWVFRVWLSCQWTQIMVTSLFLPSYLSWLILEEGLQFLFLDSAFLKVIFNKVW